MRHKVIFRVEYCWFELKIFLLVDYGSVNTSVRMHHMDVDEKHRKKARWKLHECYALFWTNPRSDTPQTYLLTKHPIFVSASNLTELDTRSMTQRSIIEGFRGGVVGHEPRLESCWTMLVIRLFCAMWVWWA